MSVLEIRKLLFCFALLLLSVFGRRGKGNWRSGAGMKEKVFAAYCLHQKTLRLPTCLFRMH